LRAGLFVPTLLIPLHVTSHACRQFGSDTDIPAIVEAQIAVIAMDDILKYQRIEVSVSGLQTKFLLDLCCFKCRVR
jgi:hypothetical protein